MNKLILLSVVFGSYIFASSHSAIDNSMSQSNVAKYSWLDDSSDDVSKTEARGRRGKGQRGRRRGGGGLR